MQSTGGVGSKTVIEIEARSVEAGPRGVELGQREHMDVLGYHMQTIIPDFRRLVHADAVLLVVTDRISRG